jgi:3-deoxy-D-manno-octulosonic-acid transferase
MTLYRILSSLLMPLWLIWIGIRTWSDKEDASRIKERFGYASKIRKGQPIWIHAASVGEAFVAITLARVLSKMYINHSFLITTGTTTSAAVVTSKLPIRTVHQFIPIDEYFCVRRFLNYWRPSLCLVVESEIWPNLLGCAAKHCPLILVNATMSDKSLARWRKYPVFAKTVLGYFSHILCQNEVMADKYRALGVSANVSGNLKYSAIKPTFHKDDFEILRQQIGERPTILAVSTHPGDEEIVCRLHISLRKLYPHLLTIIAPRHTHRASQISDFILAQGLTVATRSNGQQINDVSDIYLADTMGELGLFFSLAKVTIIGGSFKDGGHNIIEPAFFDTSIIFGPDMRNFKDIAAEFINAKAAIQILDEKELLEAAKLVLEEDTTDMRKNATAVLQKQSKVIDDYLKIISECIT